MKLRRGLFVLLVFALAGVGGSAAPGLFSPRAVAQTTAPPFSCFFAAFNQFNNLFNSGIQCSTPGPGPSGNFTSLVCSGLATCSPATGPTPAINVPSPMPTATSTGCGTLAWSGAFPYVLTGNFSSCATQSTPSPSATSTGCGVLSWTGSWPYTINGNFTACGGGSTGAQLYTPVPIPSGGGFPATPTPEPGYLAVGGVLIGPNAPSPGPWPYGVVISSQAGICAAGGNQNFINWGTDTATVSGVAGTAFEVGCYSNAFREFSIDGSGDVGIARYLYLGPALATPTLYFSNSTGADWENSSTSGNDCVMIGGADDHSVKFSSFGHGVCTIGMLDLSASTTLCTDTSANDKGIISCPTTTGVHAFTVAATTASGCTQFVSCGTVSFSFPTAYSASPYCSSAGVQDTTTSTQMWVTGITAVSTSSITFSYSPLVTTGAAHSLILTFTCGTS